MEQLQDIRNSVISCERCKLANTRRRAVPGEGIVSELMLVGEAPGSREDALGRPFVGSAGKFLNQLLTKAGLSRESVYITNLVKCRPPNNRDPEKEEIDACSPYLIAEINVIKPRIIVTLGSHSTAFFQKIAGLSQEPISRARGKTFEIAFEHGKVIIFPSYHPAAALYNPNLSKVMEEDFIRLSQLVNRSSSKTITIESFLDQNGSGNKG
ncbi:uracil-DNA glycosylase [Metallosphaera tengchongensis]|uniref:Type-4 uracil-DNA glycosylase n=1 Tax=Metallosphaera tengchongensis TaxID=1532350 RepID=A0A6N0NX38_9CREN|nr:type-4 uracil-DNA glycosylase [Metallosphaera tengchongensis]QKQ99670.1 uracil-DNA glycosylase [Metallosphaera tengchongensis]